MILYQLTDEDADQVATDLGLDRPLTDSELTDIKS